jgi:DNA polymerase-3 subunit delta'
MSRVPEPIGHEAIRASLQAYATSRAGGDDVGLHHAWLFAGPAGVGKFLVARWWASLLKCPEAGACEPECESCRLVAGGVHPDVYETGPAPKKNAERRSDGSFELKKSVGVDESRAMIQRLSLRPTRPGPRIAILREASTMTPEAQNALLKLLEEPPGSAVIILVSDNIGAMLTTVRSRCRTAAFGALSLDEIALVLTRLGKPRDEAEAAAACARGSVSRALTFDPEGLADRESVLLAWERLRRSGEETESVLRILVERKESGYALADLLEWQLAKVETSLGRPAPEPSAELAAILAECEGADPRALLAETERVQRTIDALARNANPRLVIRDLLLNVRA